VYAIPNEDELVKVYHAEALTPTRQKKVLNLCSRYENFKPLLKNAAQFAFPEKSAEDETGEVVGFAMQKISDCFQLDELQWSRDGFPDCNGHTLTLREAIDIVYSLYVALGLLHRSRIVIGDLNPSNLLYNFTTKKVAFIDLDSVQIDTFDCPVTGNGGKYLDPIVKQRGVNAENCYKYDEGSDNYALAVVACEMLTGGDPFEFRGELDPEERRERRIAIIGYAEDADFAQRTGLPLKDCLPNQRRLERFQALRSEDPILFKYLADVLLRDCRESLLRRLPKNDSRHPEYAVRYKKVKTIADVLKERSSALLLNEVQLEPVLAKIRMMGQDVSKSILGICRDRKAARAIRLREQLAQDPQGFKMFMANFGFDYRIMSGGTDNA